MVQVQVDGIHPCLHKAERNPHNPIPHHLHQPPLERYSGGMRYNPYHKPITVTATLHNMPAERPTYLSLGAGVQSSALLLALQTGHIVDQPLRLAIFADTGWEPSAVYRHLDQLRAISKTPITITQLSPHATLREDILSGGNLSRRRTGTAKTFVDIPAHFKHPGGKRGLGQRQCTGPWKIVPVERAIRKDLGVQAISEKHPIRQLIGISADEWQRMKTHKNSNIENVYPLVDNNWDRQDCLDYLHEHWPELSPQKSACIGCPFHTSAYWLSLPEEEKQDAIEVDRAIRHMGEHPQYLHRSLIPLEDVFAFAEMQPSLFDDDDLEECGGVCHT